MTDRPGERLRAVFMGTPEIAVPALRSLARSAIVSCVITQPDRPAGRGHHLHESAVKVAARELGLPLWQPETLKGQGGDPRLACDLAVVMAYGELLRQDVLDRPLHGCINLHASLLPRWRGASPLQAALRAGDARTGVTVMRMVRGLDAGPIYSADELPLAAGTTLPVLHDAMAAAAAAALERFLAAWPPQTPEPQDESRVTLCRKLTSEDGRLDFTLGAVALERWVRAYTPAPGCWTMLSGERVRVHALRIIDAVDAVDPGGGLLGLAPGALARHRDLIAVGCADGAVAITRLQPPNKRPMDAREYLNGHALPVAIG